MSTAPATAAPADDPRPLFDKKVVYDRETRDYAMYLDGELIGFARTYHEAEVTLDELAHEILTRRTQP